MVINNRIFNLFLPLNNERYCQLDKQLKRARHLRSSDQSFFKSKFHRRLSQVRQSLRWPVLYRQRLWYLLLSGTIRLCKHTSTQDFVTFLFQQARPYLSALYNSLFNSVFYLWRYSAFMDITGDTCAWSLLVHSGHNSMLPAGTAAVYSYKKAPVFIAEYYCNHLYCRKFTAELCISSGRNRQDRAVYSPSLERRLLPVSASFCPFDVPSALS